MKEVARWSHKQPSVSLAACHPASTTVSRLALPIVPLFGCLWLPEFSMWAATRANDKLRLSPCCIHHRGHIVAVNAEARTLGVRSGWTLHRATSLHSGLLALPMDRATCAHTWEQVLASLSDLTPRIESVKEGQCLFEVPTRKAERRLLQAMVADWGARCGVAGDRASAELAALTCSAGKVRRVREGRARAFRDKVAVAALSETGLSAHTVERMRWFGLSHIGTLRPLSRAQLCAQFPEGALLSRFAHGGRGETRTVSPYQAPPAIEVRFVFEQPATQPGEWEMALRDLLHRACEGLNGHGAGSLSVAAETSQGRRAKNILLREPVTRPRALFAPAEELALPLVGGELLEALSVRLGALSRVADQEALWLTPERRRSDLHTVVRHVETRLPGTLQRIVPRDVHAPLPEERYGYVPALEGQAAPPPYRKTSKPLSATSLTSTAPHGSPSPQPSTPARRSSGGCRSEARW